MFDGNASTLRKFAVISANIFAKLSYFVLVGGTWVEARFAPPGGAVMVGGPQVSTV